LDKFMKAAIATGFSPFDLASMRHYVQELAGGTYAVGAPTDHVEMLTGRPAEDIETIACRYINHPELIAPGIRAGTKLGASLFVARMMFTRVPNFDRWEREHLLPSLNRPLLAHENPAWRAHAQTQRLYLLDESVAAGEKHEADSVLDLGETRVRNFPFQGFSKRGSIAEKRLIKP